MLLYVSEILQIVQKSSQHSRWQDSFQDQEAQSSGLSYSQLCLIFCLLHSSSGPDYVPELPE
jgi:hypothetical protein